MQPTLSIIIPTPDGVGLSRCIRSIVEQEIVAGDEVLIVGDTHSGALDHVEEDVCRLGGPFRYLAHDAGRHAWGHPQINFGMEVAHGDYLVFQDDDDIFTEGAFAVIRAALALQSEPVPHMFRFVTQNRRLLWQERRLEEGVIGGHQFVIPNLPGRVGEWTDRYCGDFDFVTSTLRLWPPDSVVWREEIIAYARPDS